MISQVAALQGRRQPAFNRPALSPRQGRVAYQALADRAPPVAQSRAGLLHERFYKDHERLAAHYLSPGHGALLLAPPAKRPPQPPLEAAAVYERVLDLFGNAEVAHAAAEA